MVREQITMIRQRLGLSPSAFAEVLGVTTATVHNWQRGAVVPPLTARRAVAWLAALAEVCPHHPTIPDPLRKPPVNDNGNEIERRA